MKLLFCLSPSLNVGAPEATFESQLRQISALDWQVEFLNAPSLAQLSQAVRSLRPDLVQVSSASLANLAGPGKADVETKTQSLPATLRAVLGRQKPRAALILSSCLDPLLFLELSGLAEWGIATRRDQSDPQWLEFSRVFYGHLASSKNVPAAFKFAYRKLPLESANDILLQRLSPDPPRRVRLWRTPVSLLSAAIGLLLGFQVVTALWVLREQAQTNNRLTEVTTLLDRQRDEAEQLTHWLQLAEQTMSRLKYRISSSDRENQKWADEFLEKWKAHHEKMQQDLMPLTDRHESAEPALLPTAAPQPSKLKSAPLPAPLPPKLLNRLAGPPEQ